MPDDLSPQAADESAAMRFDVLAGYKTYIAIGLVVAAMALKAAHVIGAEEAQALYSSAGALGLYGLRAAIERVK